MDTYGRRVYALHVCSILPVLSELIPRLGIEKIGGSDIHCRLLPHHEASSASTASIGLAPIMLGSCLLRINQVVSTY